MILLPDIFNPYFENTVEKFFSRVLNRAIDFFEKHTVTRLNCNIADSILYIYIYQIHCISFCSTSFSNFSKRFSSQSRLEINQRIAAKLYIPNNFAVKHLFFHSQPETFYAVYALSIVFYRYCLSSRKGNCRTIDIKQPRCERK